ncbi:unnamed protein product [Nezara viridula]|uniref:non-specific serine/threonine protein kinase n=1 Tax=Nezara viridula TaxID=85310 RepID=A0A9P0H3E8_NEZVI|nr:unnamed protein product [Nezara viridula]
MALHRILLLLWGLPIGYVISLPQLKVGVTLIHRSSMGIEHMAPWWHSHDSSYLYMVFDYVPGGELFSYLRNAGRFPTSTAMFYTSEIVVALEYLHSQSIVYRDLKPENLLLDKEGHLKITDFGFAKKLTDRSGHRPVVDDVLLKSVNRYPHATTRDISVVIWASNATAARHLKNMVIRYLRPMPYQNDFTQA